MQIMIKERNRLKYALIIAAVILAGLGIRSISDYLPRWVNLYLGDILWAMMVFFLVGFIFKRKPTLWAAIVAIAFSFLIELSQLYQAPWINEIRRTAIGGLVLGFGFMWSDLISYTVGITIGSSLEKSNR